MRENAMVIALLSYAKIRRLHAVVGEKLRGAAARRDPAGLDHIAAIRDGERGAGILFDQQHGQARALEPLDRRRGSARPASGPAPSKARRAAAAAASPSARGRSPASAAGRPTTCRRSRRGGPQAWETTHRPKPSSASVSASRRLQAPSLRLSSTDSGANSCRPSGTCAIPSATRACAGMRSMHRSSNMIRPPEIGCTPEIARIKRGLAGAVGPHQGDDLAGRDRQRNAVQRLDAAVTAGDVLNRQHGCSPARRGRRDRLRSRPGWRAPRRPCLPRGCGRWPARGRDRIRSSPAACHARPARR